MQSTGYQVQKEGRDGELLFNGYRALVWDDEEVLKMDSGDDCTTWCIS